MSSEFTSVAGINPPIPGGRTGPVTTAVDSVSGLVNDCFEWFGNLGIFFWRVLRAVVTPPYEWRELVRQLDEVGSKSLPLVALAGAAIGAVLSMEARSSLTQFGAKSMRPSAIVYSESWRWDRSSPAWWCAGGWARA